MDAMIKNLKSTTYIISENILLKRKAILFLSIKHLYENHHKKNVKKTSHNFKNFPVFLTVFKNLFKFLKVDSIVIQRRSSDVESFE